MSRPPVPSESSSKVKARPVQPLAKASTRPPPVPVGRITTAKKDLFPPVSSTSVFVTHPAPSSAPPSAPSSLLDAATYRFDNSGANLNDFGDSLVDDAPGLTSTRKRTRAGDPGDAGSSKLARTSTASLRASRGGSQPTPSPRLHPDALPFMITPSTSQSSQPSASTSRQVDQVLHRLAILEDSVDRQHADFKHRMKEIRDLCAEIPK
jgi:hypothetical protein